MAYEYMPVDLVLVRHGENEGNFAKRCARLGDDTYWQNRAFRDRHNSQYRLTDTGRAQACSAGTWIKEHISATFDKFYTSECARALETAAFLAMDFAKWNTEVFLRERDRGVLASKTRAEGLRLHADDVKRQPRDRFCDQPPGGESIANVCIRVESVINTIQRECSGLRCLVVCHGDVIKAFQVLLQREDTHIRHSADSTNAPCDDDALLWHSARPTDSAEAAHTIYNGQVVHYTRRNPATGEVHSRLQWVRSVCPWRDPTDEGKFEAFSTVHYSNDELLRRVAQIPQLINGPCDLSINRTLAHLDMCSSIDSAFNSPPRISRASGSESEAEENNNHSSLCGPTTGFNSPIATVVPSDGGSPMMVSYLPTGDIDTRSFVVSCSLDKDTSTDGTNVGKLSPQDRDGCRVLVARAALQNTSVMSSHSKTESATGSDRQETFFEDTIVSEKIDPCTLISRAALQNTRAPFLLNSAELATASDRVQTHVEGTIVSLQTGPCTIISRAGLQNSSAMSSLSKIESLTESDRLETYIEKTIVSEKIDPRTLISRAALQNTMASFLLNSAELATASDRVQTHVEGTIVSLHTSPRTIISCAALQNTSAMSSLSKTESATGSDRLETSVEDTIVSQHTPPRTLISGPQMMLISPVATCVRPTQSPAAEALGTTMTTLNRTELAIASRCPAASIDETVVDQQTPLRTIISAVHKTTASPWGSSALPKIPEEQQTIASLHSSDTGSARGTNNVYGHGTTVSEQSPDQSTMSLSGAHSTRAVSFTFCDSVVDDTSRTIGLANNSTE